MKRINIKNFKGKIGYCDNKDLGIKNTKSNGHYVYIRKINNDGTCDVNVVTSLEDKNKKVNSFKINQVRKGNTYPIPFYDANFTRWSGITKIPIKNIEVSKIKNIGVKKIKNRHRFFIGKFMKK